MTSTLSILAVISFVVFVLSLVHFAQRVDQLERQIIRETDRLDQYFDDYKEMVIGEFSKWLDLQSGLKQRKEIRHGSQESSKESKDREENKT